MKTIRCDCCGETFTSEQEGDAVHDVGVFVDGKHDWEMDLCSRCRDDFFRYLEDTFDKPRPLHGCTGGVDGEARKAF